MKADGQIMDQSKWKNIADKKRADLFMKNWKTFIGLMKVQNTSSLSFDKLWRNELFNAYAKDELQDSGWF